MSDKWRYMTAADLGRGIADGDIDPVDLAETYLDAIAAHPDSGRIYARTTPDRARAEARAASARMRAGQRRSALDGVPISWKDLYDTAGTLTEAGSGLLEGRVPDTDAEVLQNATSAGLVCLGKTHMTELAFSGLGLNPVTATPPNINDPAVAPGGSSSGAATSVAHGLAAAGIGSDTGGSVRIPSAWNNLVGLKTSVPRLSCKGVVPLCASFDTVGPLCRSVADAALLLAALEGGTPADLAGASLAGTRFLVLEGIATDEVEAPVAAGISSAIERLQAAGALVERHEIDAVREALSLAPMLFAPEAYGTWRDAIEAAPDRMHAAVRERFRGGGAVSASDHVAAWIRLRQLRDDYARATAGFDAVLLPASPIMPPNVAALNADDDLFVRLNLLALRNTRIGNMMGLAVAVLPTGLPSVGLMMQVPELQENRLLRLAAAAEAALA